MADEVSRTRSVRRITAPGDTGTYIDLKVIDEITFREERPPYQEWVLGFRNNPTDAARTVHVVEVGDDKLKVERIDTLDTTETTGRQQEALWAFLNNDDPPVHLKTHKKKIYASDGNGTVTDTGTWIEVQRIDEIEFEDQQDEVRGQESIWVLSNPDIEDENDDYKNLTAPVKEWDGTTINPPWRLDPFQTIVDAEFGWDFLIIKYSWSSNADLDIRHNQKEPLDAVVGWGISQTISDFGFYGGDNTGHPPTAETVYYDLKKARKYMSDNNKSIDFVIELRAFWYDPPYVGAERPISPLKIEITKTKGGSVTKDSESTVYAPTDAKSEKTETITIVNVDAYLEDYGFDSNPADLPGKLIGTIKVSASSGNWEFI